MQKSLLISLLLLFLISGCNSQNLIIDIPLINDSYISNETTYSSEKIESFFLNGSAGNFTYLINNNSYYTLINLTNITNVTNVTDLYNITNITNNSYYTLINLTNITNITSNTFIGGINYSAGYGLYLTNDTFIVNTTTIQNRVSSSCPSGESIRVINSDGSVTCEVDSVGGSDGNNYPTSLNFLNNILTLQRNGLSDLTTIINLSNLNESDPLWNSNKLNYNTTNELNNYYNGVYYNKSNPSSFITTANLSSYATQSQLSGNLSNYYLASNPSSFITTANLSSYATQSQLSGNLSNYNTTSQLNNYYNSLYYNKSYIDFTFLNYYTAVQITTNYALKSELTNNLSNYYLASNPSSFITTANLSSYATQSQLSNNLSNYLLKTTDTLTGNLTITDTIIINKTGNFYIWYHNATLWDCYNGSGIIYNRGNNTLTC